MIGTHPITRKLVLPAFAFAASTAVMASVITESAQAGPGVPANSCRTGFFPQPPPPQAPKLCMSGLKLPTNFVDAATNCQFDRARVADYVDWRFRFIHGDHFPAPVGIWLGPITADNRALFVNKTESPTAPTDIDGETSRSELRRYACAHDRF
jgi:hypothetical protein